MPKKKVRTPKKKRSAVKKRKKSKITKIFPAKSEIRIDEIHDRFVIIAPGRSKRPHDVPAEEEDRPLRKPEDSPFYREVKNPSQPALHQVGPDKWWEIKVIKNIYPFLHYTNPKAYGHQEVVIETPHPNKELAEFGEPHIFRLLQTYQARTKSLTKDSKIKYIIIFKNHGGKAGASLVHAHSQIMAAGFVPNHIVNKLARARQYQIKHGHSYYYKLAQQEVKGPRRIYSDRYISAFCPYASSYNYEAWIVPKRQVDNITMLDEDELKSLAHALKLILTRVNELNLPYNFYMHQTLTDPNEYFYMRICPRRDTWAGVELGSRVIVNTVPPEQAAKYYRKKSS